MARQRFDLISNQPSQSSREYVNGILVETEHHARVNHDAALVNFSNRFLIFVDAILMLAGTLQRTRIERFKTDKQTATAAFCHQIQQFKMPADVGRYSSMPYQAFPIEWL